MKNKLLEKTSGEKGGQQQEQVKIGKEKEKGKKRKPNVKEKKNEKESKTNKAATDNKRKARPQGKQVIPAARDAHSCSHKGWLELEILPSNYLKNYMREGGWRAKTAQRERKAVDTTTETSRTCLDLFQRKGKETWDITTTVG
jgi:hypothetical protein